MAYGDKEIKEVGEKLKVDFNKIPFEQFKKGIYVEMEHKDINNSLEFFAKIAKTHLEESPDYYKELAKMEKKLKIERKVVKDLIRQFIKEDANFKNKLKFELSKDDTKYMSKYNLIS